jgi:hypothetical protein
MTALTTSNRYQWWPPWPLFLFRFPPLQLNAQPLHPPPRRQDTEFYKWIAKLAKILAVFFQQQVCGCALIAGRSG